VVPGGDDLTTDSPTVIEDGTWDLDNKIRDRYNAGTDPKDIAQEIGRSRDYVARRLLALSKWGEVKRRPGGVWSYGGCSLPEDERPCKILRPTTLSPNCRACKHRGKPFDSKVEAKL